MLVDAHGKTGEVGLWLHAVDEALAVVHKNAVRHYEAELYRLKGELLLRQAIERGSIHYVLPLQAEAGLCFRQALDVAHRQHAKSLELRAAVSLSRLWQQQGKHAEARRLLAEIYAWFTEGYATPDLQEARALLDTLR
jgi:predicted ATPase